MARYNRGRHTAKYKKTLLPYPTKNGLEPRGNCKCGTFIGLERICTMALCDECYYAWQSAASRKAYRKRKARICDCA